MAIDVLEIELSLNNNGKNLDGYRVESKLLNHQGLSI